MRLDDEQLNYKHVKHGTNKLIMEIDKSSEAGEIKVPAQYASQVLKFLDELGARDKKKKAEEDK
ncbi:hypothetical protein Csa_015479 [Cucumis sativus]|uniref:Uncharacterized protein n=1 Tax=Cucumis sativus TaxID=3659 RepID=A0A0A0LBC4_CUCSA|nr:hypothetical protein Csa_015479 [Cucumis sativus]